MPLCSPFSIRLAPEQVAWLDAWRGASMSRATAIRILLDQSMHLHRDGILPATGYREQA